MGEGNVDNPEAEVSGKMTEKKKGAITRLLRADKKTKKVRKAKVVEDKAWTNNLTALRAIAGQILDGSALAAEKLTLLSDLDTLEARRPPDAKAGKDLLTDLAALKVRTTDLLARWKAHEVDLAKKKAARTALARKELAADLARLKDASGKAWAQLRDHGKTDQDDYHDALDVATDDHDTRLQAVMTLETGPKAVDTTLSEAAFAALVDAEVTSFQTALSVARTAFDALVKRPGRTDAERKDFVDVALAALPPNDPHGTKEIHATHEIRSKAAKDDEARLTAAVEAMTERIAELKAQRLGKTPDERLAELETEAKALRKALKAAQRDVDRMQGLIDGNPVKKKAKDPNKPSVPMTPETKAKRAAMRAAVKAGPDAAKEEMAKFVAKRDEAAKEVAENRSDRKEIKDNRAVVDRDHLIDMSADGKKALEDEYNILKDQLEVLTARKTAIETYAKAEQSRLDTMIAVRERREALVTGVDALAQAAAQADFDLKDPAFDLLKDVTLVDPNLIGAPKDVAKALKAATEDLRSQIARLHATVDRGQRLSPLEPEIPRISKAEHDLLIKLLDGVAAPLIAESEFEAAAKVQMKVRGLLIEFQNDTARQTALPPLPAPAENREKNLTGQVKTWEARILSLQALGKGDAKALEKERAAIADLIKSEADKDDPDWNGLQRRIDALGQEIEAAEAEPFVPSTELKKGREAAAKAADTVQAGLLKLLNVEKMSDKEIALIDMPGKIWGREDGKSLKPKDAIPFDDVILRVENGTQVAYRIKTKETGGKDIVRRADDHHHVPREMMAMIRSDAEILDLMAQSEVEGMAEIAATFAAEAETRIKAVLDPGADALYKQVEKDLEKIADILTRSPWFGHNSVARMHPAGHAPAMKQLEDFKKSYPRELPNEAAAQSLKLLKVFEDLRDEAEALEKTYEAAKKTAAKQIKDFDDPLKTTNVSLFNVARHSDQLLGKVDALLSDDEKAAFAKAAERSAHLGIYEGKWRKEIQSGHRLIKQKTTDSVDAGEKKIKAAVQERQDFLDKLDEAGRIVGSGSPSQADLQKLADFVRLSTATLADSADSEEAHAKALRDWTAGVSALEKTLDGLKKTIAGKAAKEVLEQKRDAIKVQLKGAVAEVEEFRDYDWGLTQLSDLTKQAEDLATSAEDGATKADGEIGKPVAEGRAKEVSRLLGVLKTQVTGLDRAFLESLADDGQKAAMGPAFDAVAQAMAKAAAALGDAAELEKLCKAIDTGLTTKGDPKSERLKRREAAMAEIRRLRSALEANPALELFRENPFPQREPGAIILLNAALHACEMAVQTSVDPRAA